MLTSSPTLCTWLLTCRVLCWDLGWDASIGSLVLDLVEKVTLPLSPHYLFYLLDVCRYVFELPDLSLDQ